MINIVTRLYRKFTAKCVVCGRPTYDIGYWYCSFTCMGYDGCFAVNADHPNNKKKPNIFKGAVQDYREFKK